MRITVKIKALADKVKANLILTHDEDDELLLHYIAAAVAYAESRQHKPSGYYLKARNKIPPTTEHAIVILATHFYESRDGATGGFFADNVNAAGQVWQTVNNLLLMDKDWQV